MTLKWRIVNSFLECEKCRRPLIIACKAMTSGSSEKSFEDRGLEAIRDLVAVGVAHLFDVPVIAS
jgi:hypothetical protein